MRFIARGYSAQPGERSEVVFNKVSGIPSVYTFMLYLYIHMAKKYLLYIHHPKFEKETKKSELVNRLLAKHYEPLPVIKTPEDAKKVLSQVTYSKKTSWGA